MPKINFTAEHHNKLREFIVDAVLNRTIVRGSMGAEYTIMDLLHNVTIASLVTIKSSIKKAIANLEAQDEWLLSDSDQKKITSLKEKDEMLNLIIGYRKHLEEVSAIAEKKAELQTKLDALKESQKTPEDRIKELEAEIAQL